MVNILSTKSNRFDSPRRQCFSLPYNCMNYIVALLSPTSLQKLQKTCKYFYSKKPISVISAPVIWYSANTAAIGSIKYNFQQKAHCQFWFTNSLYFYGNPGFCIKRIYRCTIIALDIVGTTINFDEFKILTAEKTIERFYLNYHIIYADGSGDVPIDSILQRLPNVKTFQHWSIKEKFLPKTLKNMLLLKFQNKFNTFTLNFDNAAEDSFDPSLLCEFLKQNIGPHSSLSFSIRRMSAETKMHFMTVIRSIHETPEFSLTSIIFHEQ